MALSKLNQYLTSGLLSVIMLLCATMVNLQLKQSERIATLERKLECLKVTIEERTGKRIAALEIPP